MHHHTSTATPSPMGAAELTPAARWALAHIRGRTVIGKFACQLWNMPTSVWHGAVAELGEAGYRIEWTHGTVADDPTVTGGYVLRARTARPDPAIGTGGLAMSAAATAGRGLEAPDDRRRSAPADGGRTSPHPQGAAMPPATFAADLATARRERDAHLRRLWQMTIEQRVAAMRRGELTLRQLAAWTGRHPEQVPMLHDEFEWIAIDTPEVCQ